MAFAAKVALILGILGAPVRGADLLSDQVSVSYEGISEAYARAIATTVSAARELAINHFGFDLPDRITVSVSAGKGERTRLYTDGSDHVFLTVPTEESLRRPAATGTYHLYGFCHEIGHMAMYRTLQKRGWLTSAGAEGWAHYFGSRLLDLVYAREGERLWPDAYDYREDGMARLRSQLKVARPEATTRAAGYWLELSETITDKGFAPLFARWNDVSPENPAVKLKEALLTGGSAARAATLEKWWANASPVLVESVSRSTFATRTLASTSSLGAEKLLARDDGASAGKSSMAGAGHAVLFDAPGKNFYLSGVQIFCARYGYPAPPAENASVWLCDEELKPIKEFPVPYSKFPRGQESWVAISVPPTLVPEKFAICVGFNPTATKGVYVHYDAASEGHSRIGLPGRNASPFTKGDWLIRAQLRPGS